MRGHEDRRSRTGSPDAGNHPLHGGSAGAGGRASVIASYGFCRTTIYKWLRAASRLGVGLKAIKSTTAPGRPRTLTPRQEQQVFRWVNGKDPRQYGLDFGLWTRAIVANLIEQKFGIQLGQTAVGELLAKLGLTPQKRCKGPTIVIRRRWSVGGERPFQPSRGGRRRRARKCSSGMSRASGRIPCTARPGG